MACELFTVECPEILVPFVAFDEPHKEFKLFALAFLHGGDKLSHAPASAHRMVEAHYLGQSPACRRVCRLAVDGSRPFQAFVFLHAALVVFLRPFLIEYVRVALLPPCRVYAMLRQLLPEDMSLKQYCGLALGEESALVARLHFKHSPYGCRFHPEHLCRMGIVGGCQARRGFTAARQQFPCAL